jgi:hypothetical protein
MGLLAVAAHAFDAWCVTRVGVTAASSMILLLASLASGTITQVGTQSSLRTFEMWSQVGPVGPSCKAMAGGSGCGF